MPSAQRRAEVVWKGNLFQGSGVITNTSSGNLANLGVTWPARTEQPGGKTSPEELIAAAHAACYAMALSNTLAQAGNPPEQLDITAVATFQFGEGGAKVASVDLEVRGRVPGLDQARFEELARKGEQGCPVSNALRNNVQINLKATLVS